MSPQVARRWQNGPPHGPGRLSEPQDDHKRFSKSKECDQGSATWPREAPKSTQKEAKGAKPLSKSAQTSVLLSKGGGAPPIFQK
mgnify:CR=1 FL=1